MDSRTCHFLLLGVAICHVLLVSYGASAAKKTLKNPGDYFKLCSRNDPDVSGCFMRAVEAAKPSLVRGIPDLKILPLDPMYIPKLEFKDGSGNFAFRQTLTNVTIDGLRNFEILATKVDLSKPYFEMVMKTPFLQFRADYEVEGKILVLPISGSGDVVFNFTGVQTKAVSPATLEMRDGKKFLKLEEVVWTIDVEGARSHFNNLFNGDKTLGDAMNKFLNDNWRDAFETYKHLPEEAFGSLFKDISNRVYQQFTFDQLFTD